MTGVTSPEDIVNLALVRIGYATRVGSLYEGSKAAKAALDVYGATRDEMLRSNEYGFSEGNIALTLLKSAPITGYVPPVAWSPNLHPPYGWLYAYAYPADCLKVRAVKPSNIFPVDFAPKPHPFGIQNDNSPAAGQQPGKVILANVQNALCVYTRQVTNPALWEPDFVDALAAALARRLGAMLVGKEAVQTEAQDEGASRGNAAAVEG